MEKHSDTIILHELEDGAFETRPMNEFRTRYIVGGLMLGNIELIIGGSPFINIRGNHH